MAFDKKLLAQGRFNNVANNDLYTCPANKIAHIDSLSAVMYTAGTTVRVFHDDTASGAGQANAHAYDQGLTTAGIKQKLITNDEGVTVTAGGKIIVQQSVANDVVWHLYGTEEDV